LALVAPGPLRYQPVNDNEPDRLFSQIVRRLHPSRGYKPKITVAMLVQPLGQATRRLCVGHVMRPLPQHVGSRLLQAALKFSRRALLAFMNHSEQASQRIKRSP
jgi:hypothetical protein